MENLVCFCGDGLCAVDGAHALGAELDVQLNAIDHNVGAVKVRLALVRHLILGV